jgi:hypothetical protein
MGALTDLKSLVFKGTLTKELLLTVNVPADPAQPLIPATTREFKIKLQTLSIPDEMSAMDKCGLEAPPVTQSDFVKYIYANLCYAIKAVNDEPVTDVNELESVLLALGSSVVAKLWDAYKELDERVSNAGIELKNL